MPSTSMDSTVSSSGSPAERISASTLSGRTLAWTVRTSGRAAYLAASAAKAPGSLSMKSPGHPSTSARKTQLPSAPASTPNSTKLGAP